VLIFSSSEIVFPDIQTSWREIVEFSRKNKNPPGRAGWVKELSAYPQAGARVQQQMQADIQVIRMEIEYAVQSGPSNCAVRV
jgi:hypothetical protein